jgi:Putative zinc-finger
VTCRRTVALGAYLLGALDPADRSEFEDHITDCPVCKAELLRLAPLPGLLQRMSPEEFEAIEAEDETPDWLPDLPVEVALAEPLPEEFAEPAGRPRRPGWLRRRGLALAAAAAVILLALGGFAMFETADSDSPVVASPVTWSAVDSATGVKGRVELIRRGWGTEVRLSMDDVPAGRKLCHMLVYSRDGNKEIAGQWSAGTYRSIRSAPGSTSIQLADIERIEITAGNGVLVGIQSP